MRSITSDKILLQHYVLGYQIHLCFPKYKLTIEVDEKGHKDRNKYNEIERQKSIKKSLVVNLLELILMDKILICMLKLVKYTITIR